MFWQRAQALLLPFSLQGLYAADGRCKSFDARANGYCRSEAVGAAFFGMDDAMITVGRAIHAGGRSANPAERSAMSMSIESALSQAAVEPDELSTQAQGLGSALADPIEISALNSVMSVAAGSRLAIGATSPTWVTARPRLACLGSRQRNRCCQVISGRERAASDRPASRSVDDTVLTSCH